MSILSVFKRKDHSEIIHYVVLIEAPLDVVGAQLTAWFDNEWRPSDATLVYKCADGRIKTGTTCQAEFKKILKANWQLEVTRIEPKHSVTSAVTGFFNGAETVTMEERGNGIKVDYRMTYEFRNPIHQIMWSLWMEDAYVGEVRKSMEALKEFCQKGK
jgi:hypothetical protein